MMFHIDDEGGRIGELWWFNSDPSTFVRTSVDMAGFHVHLYAVRWGTWGWGRDVRMWLEPAPYSQVDDF